MKAKNDKKTTGKLLTILYVTFIDIILLTKNRFLYIRIRMRELIHARTSVYNINYHLVWCVKYRRKVLIGDIETRLRQMLHEIAKEKGFTVKTMETMPDHVHLFVSAHPKYSPLYLYKMIIEIQKSFKYRIYPTKSQITNLENQFSMCRHLYNWSLSERIKAYENEQKTIIYKEQQNQLPTLKQARPWFKSVHSQVLQNVLKRLDDGYKSFFRRVKEGSEAPGFPKFKKRGQWDSITFPQYRDDPKPTIKVPKVGDVKVCLHRVIPVDAKVKTLTIIKDGGRWFACFSCAFSRTIEPKQELPAIGIDLGLIDFLYDSNGKPVAAPKFFRKSQKHLEKLQRRFTKAEKRSKKWYKLLKAIQKAHFKIKCQRQDFLHKTANDLLDQGNVIIYEKLNIKGLSKRPKPKQDENGQYQPNGASAKAGLNKSINDAGWYKFLTFLAYKAKEQGKRIIGVPAHYTSQKCSACGEIIKKSLSIRTHKCSCGFVANRDYNAALNILALGLGELGLDS